MRHAGGDCAHAVLGESLGEGDALAFEIVGADEVDAEAREIARRRGAVDVERGHAGFEQASSQLVLDDGAGADRRLVHDEVVRRDAERESVAQWNRAQRVVARGDRLDADRARRGVGMELPDGPGQEFQDTFDRARRRRRSEGDTTPAGRRLGRGLPVWSG